MDDIKITGYIPGAIGWITQIHGAYYHQHWNMGVYFEAKVASDLAELMNRFDPTRDGMWLALDGDRIIGSIIIDGKDAEGEGARLRLFILDPAYQGRGIGGRLITEAMSFCRRTGFKRVYLTTFSGLNSARHLYEKHGFRLCQEMNGEELTGNAALTEQVFEVWLPS
jgi:GNAT superfamily N-acetyltransferase